MPPMKNQPEKPKSFSKSLKKLFGYSKKFMPIIIISLILSVAASVLSVLGPNKLSDLSNEIMYNMYTGINFSNILNIVLILILIYGLSAIFNGIQGLMMASASQKISKNLRQDINKKILHLPFSYIDSTPYGNIMNRSANDVDTISHSLNHSFSSFLSAITLIVACIIMMFTTNWIMAFTAIISSLLGFFLMAIIISKSQKHFVSQQKSLGEINGHIEESFSAHEIIKVYNAGSSKKKQFDKINNKLYQSSWKSQFFSGIMPLLMQFIGNFSYVAVCVVGAVLVSSNLITIGTIVAFIIYARLFSNPLSQIAQSMSQLQSCAAASERVFDLLEQQEIKPDVNVKKINTKKIKGNVEFKNVSFGYTPDKTIIKDFSASVKKGQKVAIVGPTGAGKTTLVNLLMRFYELDSGDITIDGISIKNIDRNDIHNIFGMVLQDTWLFEGTVRENLVYNQENVSDNQLDKICKVCGLSHFISTLPDGYDTILNDNTAVSVGQKQLMTIARAMIQNCNLLILDEATSSIDTRTELLIQNAMDKLTEKRTSFVIAHRLSTIKNADLILVMRDGNIVEQGNHNELLKQNGFYAELYNSQFENN